MKKMNSHQKQRWNKLTSKRRKKHLKRRGHIKRLKLAERKINITRKRMEQIKTLITRAECAGGQTVLC